MKLFLARVLLVIVLASQCRAACGEALAKLELQGDGVREFMHVAVSDDGKWVASDGPPIQIWESRSALLWDTWPSASGERPLVFTPDSKELLTSTHLPGDADGFGVVAVCAVPSGQLLRTLDLSPACVWCDDTVVRGLRDGCLREFDLRTGHLLSSHSLADAPTDASGYAPRFAFSRNGNFLIEGSKGVIRWWRVSDGLLLGKIVDSRRALGLAAISNDSQWLASEGDNPNWTPPTDSVTDSAYVQILTLIVWKAATASVMSSLAGYDSLDYGAQLLEFSADGTTLFGAGETESRFHLDRYHWANGVDSVVPPRAGDLEHDLNSPLALSRDGHFMVAPGLTVCSSSFTRGLQLWNLAAVKPIATFPGALRGAAGLCWSPDGKYLAGGGERLTVWDAHTGALLVEDPGVFVERLAWENNDTLRTQTLGKAQWFRAPKFAMTREMAFGPVTPSSPDGYFKGISFSPDGKFALSRDPTQYQNGAELLLWNVGAGKVIRSLTTPDKDWDWTEFEQTVWTPDDRHVIFGTVRGMSELDLLSGKVDRAWSDPTDSSYRDNANGVVLLPMAVSQDGHWLVARANRDRAALIYDLGPGTLSRRLNVPCGDQAAFAKDCRTLIIGTTAGLKWWDIAGSNPSPLNTIPADPNRGWTISPDEQEVAFDATDTNGVSIWSASRGTALADLYLLGGDPFSTTMDWIAVTPRGFYDASARGEQRLRWRDQNGFWPLNKSRALFRKPREVAAALSAN